MLLLLGNLSGLWQEQRCGAVARLTSESARILYLSVQARRALRALKGLVKFQALVRKQVGATIYSMQALLRAQLAIRSKRAELLFPTKSGFSSSPIKMPSKSQPSTFLIKYHRGGVFVRDPDLYEYKILLEIPDVDLVSLGLAGFINQLKTECTGSVKSIFYLVLGLEFHLGLKPLKYDSDFDAFVQCGVNHDHVLHVYSSSSEFDLKMNKIMIVEVS
ncbi:hypothetical protein Tco_0618052 [Tanacetum coccineum]